MHLRGNIKNKQGFRRDIMHVTGMKALNLFLAVLNVSTGIIQESYENILRLIDEKTEELSATSMKNTAVEIKNGTGSTKDELTDTTCMFDGTWQRRGHSSLVGAVGYISAHNYKVIDI